jgi:hypothetical protein
MVVLDEAGKTKVIFPAGTKASYYKAVLQGITTDGSPITSEAVFGVE